MHRFYTDEQGIRDGEAFLAEEDARHALKVLRLSVGDRIQLFDSENRYDASLAQINGDQVRVTVAGILPSTEAALRITLYQGLPKADKMELIVQKATELGATSIVPVQMRRSVVRLDEKEAKKKNERWQKIAREACKQSGRCRMPEVSLPIPFSRMTALFQSHDAVIVPWEDCEGHGPISVFRSFPGIRSMGIVIGPEGGIDPEEIEQMKAAGARPVTLGKRILRTETAGLAAISAILCLYGEME